MSPRPPTAALRWARRRPASVLAGWLACAACHRDPPPVAPGEPVPAPPEAVLGSMDTECDGLVSALASYRTCRNLDDNDRRNLDGWTQRMQEDFAAGKKTNPEPNAQHAIAAACRKAIASVAAANERCHNGPKPPQ